MKLEPLTGEKLLKTAINQILKDPSTWDQTRFHSDCGTKHCIAGHCQILAGKPMNKNTAAKDAQESLGISSGDADYLFAPHRSLGEIYYFAENFSLGDGYDRDGYNRDGYNRYGYDRYGYDRYGYDRDGYNRDGYNRYGYDRYGYNRDGYNRDGYNRDGYDRYGYDRDGYNRDGYNRYGYDRYGYDRDGGKLVPFEI